MTFSQEEVRKAENITYNVSGFAGILEGVVRSQVQVGNYNSIHADLKHLGISQSDRNELEQILDEIATAAPKEKQSVARRGMNG